MVHPHEPDTVYVFPINGADGRCPPDGQGPGLALHATRARPGRRWATGLPDGFYVARDARRDVRRRPRPAPGLYFGARNGAVWASPDEGASWQEIHEDLPDVLVVRAARICMP